MTTDPFYTASEKAKENTVHTLPSNDLEPHIKQGEACLCGAQRFPVTDEADEIVGFLVVHNSYDGRELFEDCNYYV